jgi:hypothetical protein
MLKVDFRFASQASGSLDFVLDRRREEKCVLDSDVSLIDSVSKSIYSLSKSEGEKNEAVRLFLCSTSLTWIGIESSDSSTVVSSVSYEPEHPYHLLKIHIKILGASRYLQRAQYLLTKVDYKISSHMTQRRMRYNLQLWFGLFILTKLPLNWFQDIKWFYGFVELRLKR